MEIETSYINKSVVNEFDLLRLQGCKRICRLHSSYVGNFLTTVEDRKPGHLGVFKKCPGLRADYTWKKTKVYVR